MKKRIILSILVIANTAFSFSQKKLIDLVFTAVDNGKYIHLDSIKVMNRTTQHDTMIYWPDTTLSLEMASGNLMLYIGYSTGFPVEIKKINNNSSFFVSQNYPNPITDNCLIALSIPEHGIVDFSVTDIYGRFLYHSGIPLGPGNHSFRFCPGDADIYFLNVRWKEFNQSIKIISANLFLGKKVSLQYIGMADESTIIKASHSKNYDLIALESGILDTTSVNKTYSFEFATNIPCPGTPTVEFGGQVYNTIQIFSQCWLKENLNVGTIVPATQEMSNNGIIEKYCYNNDTVNCSIYGGLYQWNEMMNYVSVLGTQGICPPAWHIPTHDELNLLEGAVDSYYGIGDDTWDYIGPSLVGYDVGLNLKSSWGWENTTTGSGNGMDLFGFSLLPSGFRQDYSGDFYDIGQVDGMWTSSLWGGWWIHRGIFYDWSEIQHYINTPGFGFSVRCVRNN